MRPKIVIVGAGGHGKVVCDAILREGKYEVVGFSDSEMPVGSEVINGIRVIASQNNFPLLKNMTEYFIVAIGNNGVREKLYAQLKQILKPATIIHPSAVVATNVFIGDGSICLGNSVVGVNSRIGENVIVNAGVIIDHECEIGNHASLSVGTIVGSNSFISEGQATAIGSIFQPFSKLNRK